MAIKPAVYSYLRFSDPKQAAGSSAARQLEYAQRWAAEHQLVLDEQLSMQDEGLSAYHQKHVTKGALGVFLQAIEDGKIAPGSVLIVEGLDRLSRAEPVLAQAQLAQIINAGITVVTASDGKEYNRARLKDQPMDLVYSLLVMIRAHEESDTKSKRVRAAIHRQCQGWLAGTWRGRIRNGKDPQWLRETGAGWEIVPEREAALRTALDMFHAGHGAVHIMRQLTTLGLSITDSGKNLSTHFYKMIRNRALVGEKVIEIDSTEYRLPGYYPALLTDAEFAQLQSSAVQRKGKKVAGEIPHLFTGMGITRCGYCGEAVVSQNLMTRNKDAQGRPMPGHRRVICVGNSRSLGCPVTGSCSVVPIEHAVMAYCSDQINLTRLLEPTSAGQGVAAQLALARADVEATARQIDRITEALTADDAPAPAAFLRRARELEATLAEQQATVSALEHQQASQAHAPTPAAAAAWAALRDGVEALDYDSRVQARQLIADTFSRIAVYHRGTEPDPTDAGARRRTGSMALLLVTHTGGSRLLHIDRRSGKLISSEDYSPDLPLPPGMA